MPLTIFTASIIIIAAFGAFFWLYYQQAQQAQRQAHGQIQELTERYQEFMRKRLTLSFVREEDWQQQKETLVQEAMEVMKPELDALAAMIGSSSYRFSPQGQRVERFQNLMSIAEELLSKSRKPTAGRISERLYAAFEDAMRADLSARWLDSQVGEQLSPR
jgi:hypothetical protein